MKPEVRAYIPERAKLAEQMAAEAMNLPAGHNYLRSREAKKFRALYSEAYVELGKQMGVVVEFPALCPCDWKPWPHRHGDEERRRFSYHRSLRGQVA